MVHESGSRYSPDDPGEPSTGEPRLSVTDEEADILSAFAWGKYVLEIGTGLGVSTHALARWAKQVITVDIDPWVHEAIFPTFGDSIVALTDRRYVPGEFDVVFIDANHDEDAVKEDIRFAREHCTGIIICHDAKSPSVEAALADQWHILDTTHGLAVHLMRKDFDNGYRQS